MGSGTTGCRSRAATRTRSGGRAVVALGLLGRAHRRAAGRRPSEAQPRRAGRPLDAEGGATQRRGGSVQSQREAEARKHLVLVLMQARVCIACARCIVHSMHVLLLPQSPRRPQPPHATPPYDAHTLMMLHSLMLLRLPLSGARRPQVSRSQTARRRGCQCRTCRPRGPRGAPGKGR